VVHPEQVEVVELEGCSRPVYSKLAHSATTRSTVVRVIHKLDRRRVLLTTPSTFCRGEFFLSRVWGKVPEGSTLSLFLEVPDFVYNNAVWDLRQRKLPRQRPALSVCSF